MKSPLISTLSSYLTPHPSSNPSLLTSVRIVDIRLCSRMLRFLPRSPSSPLPSSPPSPPPSMSSGCMEMSRTTRNCPQLFKCSFSRRKKFHTKRLTNVFEEREHNSFKFTTDWGKVSLSPRPQTNPSVDRFQFRRMRSGDKTREKFAVQIISLQNLTHE